MNNIISNKSLINNLKALIVVTSNGELGKTGKSTGWYLSEVSHVYQPLKAAGIEIDFASPLGGAAPMDHSSYDLGDQMNKQFVDDTDSYSKIKNTIPIKNIDPSQYNIIFFAGGHGTMWDFSNNEFINQTATQIYESGGIVAAVCHGPAALINLKLTTGDYLVSDKKLTAFSNLEEEAVGLTSIVPFSLENELVHRNAKYEKMDLWQRNVVVDGRLITGQNPASAYDVGLEIVKIAHGIENQ